MICESYRHGGTYVSSRCGLEKRQVWRNIKARRLVAFSGGSLSGFRRVSGIRQLGRIPEQSLHLWTIYLTVLFTRAFRQFPARLVWPETEMVPGLSAFFPGSVHSLDTRPVPRDLLLLPRRVLQIVLGRSSGVRGERAPQELSGGTNFSPHSAEFSSLLSEALVRRLGLSGLRRSKVVLFSARIWDRDRKPRSRRECRASWRICIRVSCIPAPNRGYIRPHLESPCTAQALRLRELPERGTQEMGLGKPILGWLFRHLHPPLFGRHLA